MEENENGQEKRARDNNNRGRKRNQREAEKKKRTKGGKEQLNGGRRGREKRSVPFRLLSSLTLCPFFRSFAGSLTLCALTCFFILRWCTESCYIHRREKTEQKSETNTAKRRTKRERERYMSRRRRRGKVIFSVCLQVRSTATRDGHSPSPYHTPERQIEEKVRDR